MEAPALAAPGRRRELAAGLTDIWPVLVACVPIALLFGALSVAKGLSVAEATLMSVLVFAGGAQFAAVELWAHPVPIATLVFSALLINARHVLMGASLARRLGRFSLAQRLVGMHFLTDESWALAERRALGRALTPAYWFAMAASLPPVWIGGTFLGALLGSLLGDPRAVGADFAFTALFIGLIAGFWRGRTTLLTVAASGAAAAIVYALAGPPWHVLAGALGGIAAAVLAWRPRPP
jgi:4-azaleucine resistance transporter AzlC